MAAPALIERHKSVSSASFGTDGRTASGLASPFYELDRGGDMMLPGCYAKAAPKFLASEAVVMLSHWEPLPIGVCTKADESEAGLEVEFKYHSHSQAEAAYTVAKERAEMGKGSGLSVGIRIKSQGYESFESGAELLDWLEKEGHDLAMVKNQDKVLRWGNSCWAVKEVDELFEFSQVCVPAAHSAGIDRIKTILGGDGSLAGLPLSEHLDLLLASVAGATKRLEGLSAVRSQDGRRVGSETLRVAKSLLEDFSGLVKGIEGGHAAPSPTAIQDRAKAAAFLLENNHI